MLLVLVQAGAAHGYILEYAGALSAVGSGTPFLDCPGLRNTPEGEEPTPEGEEPAPEGEEPPSLRACSSGLGGTATAWVDDGSLSDPT